MLVIRAFSSAGVAPSCKKCRYQENGVCKLFKYNFAVIDVKNYIDYVDVDTCRTYDKLCGPSGKYFKPILNVFDKFHKEPGQDGVSK
jgi:hypothetical protein